MAWRLLLFTSSMKHSIKVSSYLLYPPLYWNEWEKIFNDLILVSAGATSSSTWLCWWAGWPPTPSSASSWRRTPLSEGRTTALGCVTLIQWGSQISIRFFFKTTSKGTEEISSSILLVGPDFKGVPVRPCEIPQGKDFSEPYIFCLTLKCLREAAKKNSSTNGQAIRWEGGGKLWRPGH